LIAVTLLPAALVFLILLLNDEQTMGKYKTPHLKTTRLVRICLGMLRAVSVPADRDSGFQVHPSGSLEGGQ
jgi:hypothetical protein